MAIDIIMPQLGETVAEGTVIKWLVPQNGHVEKDQPILEVETDKVALEIPAPASGALSEILVREGETVAVGTVLGRLEIGGQPVETRSQSDTERRQEGLAGTSVKEGEHFSPAVRRLAKEYGVDLYQIRGTGAGGRITKTDVLAYLERQRGIASGSPSGEIGDRAAQETPADRLIPLTSMRRTIAQRMVESRRTAAHATTFFEVDFRAVDTCRTQHNLTYLPFVVHAVVQGLRAYPILNSSWTDEGILCKGAINIGIAVAVEDGLLVPVIARADRYGLLTLAKMIADLAHRARTKQLKPDEVQGGTFSITNHGGMGSVFSTPIIHQPQIAILGVGAVCKRAVVLDDAIAIRPIGILSLSFDHRVIDGATADRFMHKVKDCLEHERWEHHL
ncbi:MAG: 2-oxo acid dehydrogenase subunit E2 [Nitrospirae bacterium]|nr:MAG: 2-oxo acid dehydrogenase subunit E2 [Nitrospirota bacterium]